MLRSFVNTDQESPTGIYRPCIHRIVRIHGFIGYLSPTALAGLWQTISGLVLVFEAKLSGQLVHTLPLNTVIRRVILFIEVS